MAKTNVNATETKVEDLKEDTTVNEVTNNPEVIVEEDSKLKKIVKITLKTLAVIATGAVGFILGRVTGNHNDDDDGEDNEPEKIEE